VPHRIIRSWYTGRWWVGCYIWYGEEGPGRAAALPSPLLAVPNVTAHPSTASVRITALLYNGPLLCGFNVGIKGSRECSRRQHSRWVLVARHLPYIEGNSVVIHSTQSHVDCRRHVLNGERPSMRRAQAPSSIRQDGGHVDPRLRTTLRDRPIPRAVITWQRSGQCDQFQKHYWMKPHHSNWRSCPEFTWIDSSWLLQRNKAYRIKFDTADIA